MSERFTIVVHKLQKPLGVPDYSHEAIVTHFKDHPLYFYGHSPEEVISDVLNYMLRKEKR